MSIPVTEKLIQRQINHWNEFRKYLTPDQSGRERPRPPVITISRLAGSGGRRLAASLCKRLDLPLHDRSLVEQVMRQENLPPALVAELDEQIATQTSLWIKGLFNHRIFLVKEYEQALARTIRSLADSVGGVFLGRGAHVVLGNRADLRVRVVASTATRRRHVRHRFDLSKAEARALVTETDSVRAEFLAKVFGENNTHSHHFDLTINTDRIAEPDLVELVLLAVLTSTGPQATSVPLKARVGS